MNGCCLHQCFFLALRLFALTSFEPAVMSHDHIPQIQSSSILYMDLYKWEIVPTHLARVGSPTSLMPVVMLNVASNGPAISKRRTSSPASCDSCMQCYLQLLEYMGVEPKIGEFYPQNGWFISMENPMNKWMIWGTTIFGNTHILDCLWLHDFWNAANTSVLCRSKQIDPKHLHVCQNVVIPQQLLNLLALLISMRCGWLGDQTFFRWLNLVSFGEAWGI